MAAASPLSSPLEKPAIQASVSYYWISESRAIFAASFDSGGAPPGGYFRNFSILCSVSDPQKFREYLEGSNLISKLQAKHDILKKALAEGETSLTCLPLFLHLCFYLTP